MNLFQPLQRLLAPPPPVVARPVPLPSAASADADAAPSAPEPAEAPGCGWFESSHALQQGLEVTEWPDTDWPVAALYFLDRAGPKPAAWQ